MPSSFIMFAHWQIEKDSTVHRSGPNPLAWWCLLLRDTPKCAQSRCQWTQKMSILSLLNCRTRDCTRDCNSTFALCTTANWLLWRDCTLDTHCTDRHTFSFLQRTSSDLVLALFSTWHWLPRAHGEEVLMLTAIWTVTFEDRTQLANLFADPLFVASFSRH